jgi:hypothetical protein
MSEKLSFFNRCEEKELQKKIEKEVQKCIVVCTILMLSALFFVSVIIYIVNYFFF